VEKRKRRLRAPKKVESGMENGLTGLKRAVGTGRSECEKVGAAEKEGEKGSKEKSTAEQKKKKV